MNIDELFDKHAKEIEEFQSTDDGSTIEEAPPALEEKKPDVDTSKKEIKKEILDNVSDGYEEYEIKTKESDRLTYSDKEIEVIEEDV